MCPRKPHLTLTPSRGLCSAGTSNGLAPVTNVHVPVGGRLEGIRSAYQPQLPALLRSHLNCAICTDDVLEQLLRSFHDGLHGGEVDTVFDYFRRHDITDSQIGDHLGVTRPAVSKMRKARRMEAAHLAGLRYTSPEIFRALCQRYVMLSGFSEATTYLRSLANPDTCERCTPEEFWMSLAVFTDDTWMLALRNPDFQVAQQKAAALLEQWSFGFLRHEPTERAVNLLREIEALWAPYGVMALCLLQERTYDYAQRDVGNE